MMSALSRSLTGLAEALTNSFTSSSARRSYLHKALSDLAKRYLNAKSWECRLRRFRGGLLAPSGEFGLYYRMPTIHEGQLLMADLIDWTLVNVSSWLAGVTADWRYLPILSSTYIQFNSTDKHMKHDTRLWHLNYWTISWTHIDWPRRPNVFGDKLIRFFVG